MIVQSIHSLRISAELDAQPYKAGADIKSAADRQMVESGQKLAGSIEQTERRLGTSGGAFERFQRSVDPAYRSSQQFEAGQRNIQRALDAGNISTERAAQLTGLLQQRYSTLRPAINDNTQAMASATAHTGQMRFALQNLSFQLNDVATSLASGGSPFRVLAQQSGQVVQVFQQGGGFSAVMAAARTSIASMITPTTAAVAGLAALGGGFALVVREAVVAETRVRSFRVILSSMGTDGLTTAASLEKVVERLRDTGSSIADATAAAQGIARTPGINPAAIGSISDVARNIAAARGTDFAATASSLAQAIAGGSDALMKYATELGVRFTPAEQAAIAVMLKHRDTAGLLRLEFDALSRAMDDKFNQSLGSTTKLVNALGAAWHDMMGALGETKPIQDAIKNLTFLGQNLTGIFQGKIGVGDIAASVVDRFNGVVATAAIPPPMVQGGALDSRFSAGAVALNTVALQQLAAILAEASKSLPAGFRVVATDGLSPRTSGTPNHPAGIAMDTRIIDAQGRSIPSMGADPTGHYQRLADAAFRAQEKLYPELSGRLASGTQFGKIDAGHFDLGGNRGSRGLLGGGLTVPTGAGATDLAKQAAAIDLNATAFGKMGQAAVEAQARITATTQANHLFTEESDRQKFVTAAVSEAVARHNDELTKAATIQDAQTAGVIRSIDAFKTSEAAGYRVIAEEQARVEVMQRGGDAAMRTRQILEESAAGAIQAGQKQVAAALPQVAAAERLADAAKKGGAAQHEAELQAAAAARTQDAVAKAEASRNPGLIAQAKALDAAALAEVRRSDAARASLANTQAIRGEGEQQQIMQLQIGLQGQTTDTINTQVNLLRTKIDLDKAGTSLTEEEKRNRLASVAATGDLTARLSEAQREQQRLDDGIRSVASTVENTLGRALEDAFSGTKTESWGTRMKSILSSLMTQITQFAFIRPAIGTALGALGFAGAAQSYGSFGSLFGGGSSGGSATLTPNGNGTFSIGNISTAASLGRSTGLFGDLGLGGIGSSINNFGASNFGFASSSVGANAFDSLGLDLNGMAAVGNGGVFGGTTLTGLLGGVGAGFGAGSLLNSLAGGNTMYGTLGSGGGALAGAIIGSIIPGIGTLLGGLIGGAGGGLFGGMFGNSRPSNASAGGNINFATGRVTGNFSGGNQQIDQATGSAVQSISQFTQMLLKASGGALSGSVLLQGGVNTGFTADSSLPGYEGRFNLGKDAARAVEIVQLALSRSVTGVSDTMRKVIDSITDPALLENGIRFAAVYDNLKKAADSAFSSIASDTQQIGPFAQALDQIKTIFRDITDQAVQFGLALEPVNAGLAEATKRLTDDFNRGIADAITGIEAPVDLLIAQAQREGKARLDDAIAVGGNIVQVNRLNALILDQIWTSQTQSLQQLADSLRGGSLSGLTTVGQLAAANDNFARTLALVQGGNLAEIGNLTAAGQSALALSSQAYGNGPQTAGLRADVLSAIDQVLVSRSFAEGGVTLPGWNRVGERGPEWMFSPTGGARVLPNGQSPTDTMMREVLAAIQAGNGITQAGLLDLLRAIQAQLAEMQRKSPFDPPRQRVA